MKGVLPFAALILIGAAWGGTQPLAKVAVSEGYRPFGILVWQNALVAVILAGITLLRGCSLRTDRVALRLYLLIAVIGTVLPGLASYSAAVHLPSGVLSMLLSSVPMLAFPVALALGIDVFGWRRLAGLSLGLAGVALLVMPETGAAGVVPAVWVAVALLASACYAIEGNYVARFGTDGLDPLQLLAGASVVGMVLSLPLAIATGQFIDPRGAWTQPDTAIVASSLLHAAAYSGYVGLVGLAGSVFAVQVSYFVTLFGLAWAMLFLGEEYSGWFWGALALMLAGLALVQPRPAASLVPVRPMGQDARR